MSSPTTSNQIQASSPLDTSGRDIIGEVDGLFSKPSYAEFCREAIEFITDLTAARSCLLFQQAGGRMVVQAQYHGKGQQLDSGFVPEIEKLAKFTRESAKSQKVTLSAGEKKLASLAIPFMGAEGPTVVMLLLGPERAPFLEPSYAMLSLYAVVIANFGNRVQLKKTQDAFLQSTLLVDLYTKASTAPDFDSAAALVTSELQEWIGCDILAVGMEHKGRMHLDSISGRKKRENRSQGYSKIMGLMREIRSAKNPVIWPAPETSEIKALVASNQNELLSVFSAGRILGLPLESGGDDDRKGAMVVIYQDPRQPNLEKFELLTAMGPHLAALLTLLGEGLPRGFRGRLRKFSRENSLGKKFLAFLSPLALAAAMFLPVPHQIRASARLTPDVSRQVAAPISGILEESYFKPGDIVQQGDLLAKLDGKEIGWRLAEATAKRDVAAKRRDLFQSKKDPHETQLATHEFQALSNEVDLLRYQKDNLEIRSPITGLILSGDLERSKGVPVETGQKLFEVAAFDKFVVEVAVNDEDINWVELQQKMTLRLESRGGKAFSSQVDQIYPVSETKEGENVFICLGTIVDQDGKSYLRPGMEGRARIEVGWKPLWWIIFQKPWNYIRVRFL